MLRGKINRVVADAHRNGNRSYRGRIISNALAPTIAPILSGLGREVFWIAIDIDVKTLQFEPLRRHN